MQHSSVHDVRTLDLEVWDGDVRTQVLVAGDGPPLVFLHPVLGLQWDPFLDTLAQTHTVYAPYLPGTAPGEPDAHKPITDNYELTLVYEEILTACGISSAAVVGHSFGGMVAADLAATFPDRVTSMVLLCPIGLWTDGRPFQNPYLLELPELAAAAFADPTGPVAQAALAMPTDPEALGEVLIALQWAMGVAGKYWWPIPDRGLSRRIHRITARTLVIWGAEDKIISPEYAHDFARLIQNARAEVLSGAAHVPQLERLDVVGPMVTEFLAG
ncbi:alpha/beta hydrolase [Sporichthya brevicatena]|uniref:Alpha/beta hydrolase n=1 Tax=Sporichthya brevicatena TaxID=171442 RepID=A0ABN1H1V6_9ACTN